MKYCGRCDKPIQTGEEYTKHDIHSGSGPGATVYRHKELCKRRPTRGTPSSVGR